MSKPQKRPIEILEPHEVDRLLRACSNKAPTGVRNRALLALLYRAGLRVSEALGLYPKDIDGEGRVRVLHGKGDKARTVALDSEGLAILQRWLDRREQLGFNGRHAVFCTLKGQPLQSVYVRNLVKRLAEKAGIEKRVHPHALRHTFAAELAREGEPINVIQAALGHSSLATTDRYLRHISPEQVTDALRARTWKRSEPDPKKPKTAFRNVGGLITNVDDVEETSSTERRQSGA